MENDSRYDSPPISKYLVKEKREEEKTQYCRVDVEGEMSKRRMVVVCHSVEKAQRRIMPILA